MPSYPKPRTAVLVEVAFKGNRKEFFQWEGDAPPPMRAPVIVEADRGEDLGYVHATGALAHQRITGVAHAPEEGTEVAQTIKRLATADEVKRVEELRAQDDVARRQAMERVKSNGLQMKLSDAEWRYDRRKLTFYFTAEKRVDFRNLVRELATLFRTRIELKQIGVRDEAKRLGGIGRCGREYCSASWLTELRPVNLGVARDQRLSLNPTQISGACGRLMCCLRYEHEFYVQQRKRFPKEGKLIHTSKGEEKVVANDIFRERVTLRGSDGEVRIVSLAELRREWRPGGVPEPTSDEETPALPLEALSDEVLRLQDTVELPAWMPRAGARGATGNEPGSGAREGRALPVRDRADSSHRDTRPARRAPDAAASGERVAGAPDDRQRARDHDRSRSAPPRAAATEGVSGGPAAPRGAEPGEDGQRPGEAGGGRRRNRRRRGRRGGTTGRPDPGASGGHEPTGSGGDDQ